MYAKQEYELIMLSQSLGATDLYRLQNGYTELDVIADICASEFGIKVSDLKGERRLGNIADCRACFFFFARNYSEELYTLKSLGQFCGDRDHTTVLSGINKIYDLLDTDAEMLERCSSILKEIRKMRSWA